MESGRYQAGDRFPSQNELAEMFQTSTVTSREAVATLVQEGLLERRFGSGTYVTGRKPERFVAVLSELDLAHPATSPSFLVTMQAARRYLTEIGVKSRVYIGHSDPFGEVAPKALSSWDFLHDLEAGRVLGVISVATQPQLVCTALAGLSIPFIDGVSMDGVPFWDAGEVVRLGVKELADKGCRRVACIGVGSEPNASLSRFRQWTGKYGVVTRPEWTVVVPFAHEHGDGVAAFQQLWQSQADKPDGLLVLDDVLYRDMAPALLVNHIRVPQDLVVASLANIPDPRPMHPEPIQIAVDVEAMGRVMARNLVNRMRDPAAKPEGIPVSVRVVDSAGASYDSLVFTTVQDERPVARRRPAVSANGVGMAGARTS